MSKNKQNSQSVTVFHDYPLPETKAKPVGYIALIIDYNLPVPLPDSLCAIGEKHKKYEKGQWRVLTPRHDPEDTLYGHLTFALKYEGIELGILKVLFDHIDPALLVNIVQSEPTGIYSRRIWFLFEWLRHEKLDLPDVTQGNFVILVNDKLQYPGPSRPSRRHRVYNNLPGTPDFCPLIRRTDQLDQYIAFILSTVINCAFQNLFCSPLFVPCYFASALLKCICYFAKALLECKIYFAKAKIDNDFFWECAQTGV